MQDGGAKIKASIVNLMLLLIARRRRSGLDHSCVRAGVRDSELTENKSRNWGLRSRVVNLVDENLIGMCRGRVGACAEAFVRPRAVGRRSHSRTVNRSVIWVRY